MEKRTFKMIVRNDIHPECPIPATIVIEKDKKGKDVISIINENKAIITHIIKDNHPKAYKLVLEEIKKNAETKV